MLCNKCCRFREELRKASNNIRLVELLLEDARKMEDSQDRLDRLAMLHKHARTNYQDVANLNYVIDNCEDHPRCSNRWTTHAKFTSNCPQSVTEIKTPPIPRCRLLRNATRRTQTMTTALPIGLSTMSLLISGMVLPSTPLLYYPTVLIIVVK